ncbi:hypothetical protein GYB29_14145 [bacterium]|nr:hypothetical protein [bacterium]
MKKIFIFTLLLFFISSSASAQDRNRYLLDIYEYDKELNELVERVVAALGGRENNLRVESFQTTGEITYQTGEKADFDLFYMKNDWFRIDQKTEEEYILFGRHGRKGWVKKIDKEEGEVVQSLKGRKLSEEEQFSLYENNLFDYEDKRLDIYYEGEIKVGEVEAYIIRLSGLRYGEEMYYISKETYRPFMKQVYFLDGKYQSVINYTIDEYTEVDGVWLPKKIGMKKGTQTKMIEFFNYDLAATFEKDFFTN